MNCINTVYRYELCMDTNCINTVYRYELYKYSV